MATWRPKNMVVTTNLNVRIPLDKLTSLDEDIEYNPEQFPGLIYRPSDLKLRILIFNSGKLVISGANSVEEIKKAIDSVVDLLKKIGIKAERKYDFEIQNVVIVGEFKYKKIDLERMATELEEAEYNPEQFPGASIKHVYNDKKYTFLVFSNGRFICTGGKSFEDVERAIEDFEERIVKKYAIG